MDLKTPHKVICSCELRDISHVDCKESLMVGLNGIGNCGWNRVFSSRHDVVDEEEG